MPIHLRASATGALRRARALHSRIAGAILASAPALEPWFIRAGRGVLARSKIGRGLYWFAEDDLVRRLQHTPHRFRRLSIGGHDIDADITAGSARLQYFHGHPYEPELVDAFARTLAPGDVCIDIGANVGFFTVLAARLVGPSGRVIAFEPHPQAAAALRETLDRNGVTDFVDVVEAAAGARDGRTRLFVDGDSIISTTDPARSPVAGDFAFDTAVDVAQVAVDTWMKAHPRLLAKFRAIKIDVEGTEAEVVAGLRDTLLARPSATIFCETRAGSDADGWLVSQGYSATFLDVLSQDTFGNYQYERATNAGS